MPTKYRWTVLVMIAYFSQVSANDSSSSNFQPPPTAPLKYCCITYITGVTETNTSAAANSYSGGKAYNCTPGLVGVTVRADPSTPVFGIYCATLGTMCQWIPASQTSISYSVGFSYWKGSWNSATANFSGNCT